MSDLTVVRSKLNNLEQGSPKWRAQVCDPAWIRRRVQVYLRYTVPSLLHQTDKDFRIWLDCRPNSQREVEACRIPLYRAGVWCTFDRGRSMLENLPDTVTHVVEIRVDSDDMLAPNIVEQAKALHLTRRMILKPDWSAGMEYLNAISWNHGYVWHVGSNRFLRQTHPSPPFYSQRLERRGGELIGRFGENVETTGESHGRFVSRRNAYQVNHPHKPAFLWCRHDEGGPGRFHVWEDRRGLAYPKRPKNQHCGDSVFLRKWFGLDEPLPYANDEVRRFLV